MIPTIGQNDQEGIPYEDRKVYLMMIYQKHYALVTEIDFEEGTAHGFVRWNEDDQPGKWDTIDISNMMDMDWIVLEFKEPIKFGEAINIGEEYYKETEMLESAMQKYSEFTNGLQKKVKKVNL